MTPNRARAPFLVMAHHRSGSNFLNDLLQAHPDVECINEPLSMHTDFFIERDLQPWTEADFDPQHLHPTLAPYDDLRAFLLEMRDLLQSSHAQRVIGFKETALFGKLGWLKAFVPGLRVIFLKREPRAIVSSVLRSGLVHFWRYRSLVPQAFGQLWPQFQPRPPGSEGFDAELVAMSVAVRYALAERALAGFERCNIDLDDLMLRPAEMLGQLARFLDIEVHPDQFAFFDKRRAASRGGAFSSFRSQADVQAGWRSHLSEAQLHAIEDVLKATSYTTGNSTPAYGRPLRESTHGQGRSQLC